MSEDIILTWQMFSENQVEHVFTFYGNNKEIKYVKLSVDMSPEVDPTTEQIINLRSDVRKQLEGNSPIATSYLGLILEDWAFSSLPMMNYGNFK